MGQRELELVDDDPLPNVFAQQIYLSWCVIRDTECTYLPGAFEDVEGARNFLGFYQCIGSVEKQKVDAVRPQCAQRIIHPCNDVLVGEVVVGTCGNDTHFGLNGDLISFRRGQLHRVTEPAFTTVQVASVHVVSAVDVRVVEEGYADLARGAYKFSYLAVAAVGDTHQPEHDVGRDDFGTRQRKALQRASLSEGWCGTGARDRRLRRKCQSYL